MKICDALAFFNIINIDTREVYEIYDNSKLIKKKSIFIAIGKGNNYIKEAINNGALIVLSDNEKEKYYIENLKEKLLPFCFFFYHNLQTNYHFIGVTGTNGKSTSAYLLHSFLSSSLLVTTTRGIKNSYVSKNTTPYPLELIDILRKAKKKKCRYIIMELSSIGMKEGRLNGIIFDKILLTNIENDHLDYHKTLEDYQNTKINFLLDSNAFLYLPVDCFVKFPLLRKAANFELYSENELNVLAQNEFKTLFIYKRRLFKSNLIGKSNLRNLSGVLTMLGLDYSIRKMRHRLKKIKPLKGRLNIVSTSPLVIIDYAHTASAFKSLLSDVASFKRKKTIVVFGAGGNRDKNKRREYGKIVEQYGDMGIVTNDNPRDEDEESIINDIIGDSSFYFIKCPMRDKAIRLAFSYASKDDLILIVGKGAEEVQLIKNVTYHFSDYEEVRKCLKQR